MTYTMASPLDTKSTFYVYKVLSGLRPTTALQINSTLQLGIGKCCSGNYIRIMFFRRNDYESIIKIITYYRNVRFCVINLQILIQPISAK